MSPKPLSPATRTQACQMLLSETGFPFGPEDMYAKLRDFAESGFINMAGGCCGNTPEHIAAIADAVRDVTPREIPVLEPLLRLSGTEPYNHTKDKNFLMIGERTNVAGSPRFRKLIQEGKLEDALSVARQQVDNGAPVIDICFDDGLIDGVDMMTPFPESRTIRARHHQSAHHCRLLQVGDH